MFVHFDPKTMAVKVLCGPCEEYKPNAEMLVIHKKTQELQQKMKKFQDEEIHPMLRAIEALIKAENEKYQPKKEPKKE